MRMLPHLWIIPILPLLAAGMISVLRQPRRKLAATLSIGTMAAALLLSGLAFVEALRQSGPALRVFNFRWFQFGASWVELGWVLDPLSALMLLMVSLVGLLIFIYSIGYMAQDENFTRFFCFLSLFAAAMLGLVISNSLLLLFICWELVGLTSYLLIGFWYHRPSAAAAAKKAFITTRVGDLALLLGMVWLYSKAGTLLFYAGGKGCLEGPALVRLVAQATTLGFSVATGISLLIFCGAIGKSGQVPLHVWLPDAMEGPTPVSALIHAATMVAAGVFLVARVYPLLAAHPEFHSGPTTALQVVAWTGVITAVFAASIAVAQNDIKRVLAYSTVSQLGFMMLGLGVGGVGVGMFHLIAHAFFKALLFMGAGSVIHGCHDEQDIRRMGGLRSVMPVTFATYAVGMLALAGFPLLFSGFWSKDEILHAAHTWNGSHLPFFLGLIAALLTAFYMTRQVCYVFFDSSSGQTSSAARAHESPKVMTVPLIILAVATVLMSLMGTPAWPWLQTFFSAQHPEFEPRRFLEHGFVLVMLISTVIVFAGLGIGYWLYGRQRLVGGEADPLAQRWPNLYTLLERKYFVDEIYDDSIVRFTDWAARICDQLDRWVINGCVLATSYVVTGLSWMNRLVDEYVINPAFDRSCRELRAGGSRVSRVQNGRVQNYLRLLAGGVVVLLLLILWGFRS
jgi:NADH-quinone oxidoreductase subunit L